MDLAGIARKLCCFSTYMVHTLRSPNLYYEIDHEEMMSKS